MFEDMYAPSRCPVVSHDEQGEIVCSWEPGHIGAASGLHWDEPRNLLWHEPKVNASAEMDAMLLGEQQLLGHLETEESTTGAQSQ